jgi:hypothetical protein
MLLIIHFLLEELPQYNVGTVICYNGGVYQENVKERLTELAKITSKQL